MLNILKKNSFAWTLGTPLVQDPLATGGLVIVNDPPIEARADDDVYIPDTILWDLAGGNAVGAPVYDEAPLTLDVTPGIAETAADDTDDLPDILIGETDGVRVAPEREGGLPDIVVHDDDDDSVAVQNGVPGIFQATEPGAETTVLGGWGGDGRDTAMRHEDVDQWVFDKPGDGFLPPQDQANKINGTDGADLLVGTDDSEIINGLEGNDIISGMEGNDVLHGQTGNDTIFGGLGDDYLIGGSGNDVMDGGSDHDRLLGGAGNDELTGGVGADQFVFTGLQGTDAGIDTITDYNIAEDAFVFSESFLDITPAEELIQNVIALEGDGGAELWADVRHAGLMQIAFVDNLTAAELQQELTEAWLI